MRVLSVDTETYLITDTDLAPKPVCVTWFDGQKAWMTHPGDIDTTGLLADPQNIFVGQNIAYDIVLMMRWHPHIIPDIIRALDESRVYDISMRERLLHLATVGGKGFEMYPSLADMTMKYLNIDISADKKGDDIWRLKYGTLDGIPFSEWPSEARRYALDDAVHTYNVFQAQGGLAATQPTEAAQVRASVALRAIGVWGFAVNQDKRAKMRDALAGKIAGLHTKVDKFGWTGKGSQERLQKLVSKAWSYKHALTIQTRGSVTGVQVDVQAMLEQSGDGLLIQLIKDETEGNGQVAGITTPPNVDRIIWLKETYKALQQVPVTKKGVSVSGDVLETLQDIVPQFAEYTELRHLEKMMENYIEPYKYKTAHPNFVPLVSTGRTGCRGSGSSANTQNIPRKDKDRPDEAFRTMFCARKGYKLGTVDYSQLELCTLAATMRWMFPGAPTTLLDAINEGKDVHCITGGLIGGLSYEQMIAGKKAKDENVLKFRQGAKAANFGLPGGLGGGAFVGYAKNNYGVTLSLNQSWKYINAWKRAWPEVPAHYLAYSAAQVDNSPTGTFTAYTMTMRPKTGCIYTEGSNYPFQGLAADGAKEALWHTWRECTLGWYWSTHAGFGYCSELRDSPLRQSHIVNFIHDEIVGEHPDTDLGPQALKRQEQIMVEVMTRTCGNYVKIAVEGQLSDAWEH